MCDRSMICLTLKLLHSFAKRAYARVSAEIFALKTILPHSSAVLHLYDVILQMQ